MLNESNEYLLAHKDDDQPRLLSFKNGTEESSIPKVVDRREDFNDKE